MKRKAETSSGGASRKKLKLSAVPPKGSRWDRTNYSCAYDALFTCMFDVWDEYKAKWSERMSKYGLYCAELSEGFEAVGNGTRSLDTVRDQVRTLLTKDYPVSLAQGPHLVAFNDLVDAMFSRSFYGSITTTCPTCGTLAEDPSGLECIWNVDRVNDLVRKYKGSYSLSHWLKAQWVTAGDHPCLVCRRPLLSITRLKSAPPFVILHLSTNLILINPSIVFKVGPDQVKYFIRGVIYHGDLHFTCRIIRANGDVWYHDGIETAQYVEPEGNVYNKPPAFLRKSVRPDITRKAICAFYARAD
ncbi:hypothetical protein B0H12DRAFT_1040062 [Mycena haematopus]|nr:hypothetical protein B0H12DRAFT_1040062 [Mycena haematopus]